MAKVEDKIKFLQEYIKNKDKYLPLIDHAWEVFEERTSTDDINVGWDVGLLRGKRPYWGECWATGITVLTYFISTKGIEDYTVEQIEKMLKKNKVVWYKLPRKYNTTVMTITDGTGNSFYSVNIIVGDDDGTYIDGGIIYGFSKLNEFNLGLYSPQNEISNDDDHSIRQFARDFFNTWLKDHGYIIDDISSFDECTGFKCRKKHNIYTIYMYSLLEV